MAGRLTRAARFALTLSPPERSRRQRSSTEPPPRPAGWHRGLVLAVGAAPTAAIVVGAIVVSLGHLADDRQGPAVGTLVLFAPMAFVFFALAALLAANDVRTSAPERLHELAPVVWFVAIAALFCQWLVFIVPPPEGATVIGRMYVWVLGVVLQGLAWAAGTGVGAMRRRQRAAIRAAAGDSDHAR